MKATSPIAKNVNGSSVAPQSEHFLTVIVYEDEAAFERAYGVQNDLIRKCYDEQSDLACAWISFASLRNAALAARLAEDAANADLVIFSTHAGNDLPAHVKAWIESWLPRKSLDESALAALVGIPGDACKGITPIHEYLREVASRGHMEFLPHVLPQTKQQ